MKKEKIKKIVDEVVMEIFELEPEELKEDADLYCDIGGNSIQKLELIVALERRLGIRYALSEETNMNCVRDIVLITESYAPDAAPEA
jgi:acyl carrier protein